MCAWFFLLRSVTPLAQEPIQPRLQSIESAIQAANASTHAVPVVVRGIVILNRHEIVIEDRSGATEVMPVEAEPIALGDEVEVTGQMRSSPQPQVQQGHLSRLWGGSMPLPLSILPDEAAGGENDLFLVQTEAKLVDFAPAGLTGVRLNLSGGHQSFSAILPNDTLGSGPATTSMQPGATLRITGILFVNHDQSRSRGDAFTIQLRTPEDVEVEVGPSWWTGPHMVLLAGLGTILILIGVNGYYRIQHGRYRAVAEERANIARDIHDTLAQGFAGISLQLEAAEQTIERDPQLAKVLLKEALQLVRHSRDESHLSIEILRSLSRSDRLDVLISHCILQLRAASGKAIEQRVSGEPVPLSYTLVNNLFRIAQEAIVNAVRHADASHVQVRIHYEKAGVVIEVEDDGRGFDPGHTPGPEEGHFGLTGMRERTAAIDSALQIQSSSSGTTIRVRATA